MKTSILFLVLTFGSSALAAQDIMFTKTTTPGADQGHVTTVCKVLQEGTTVRHNATIVNGSEMINLQAFMPHASIVGKKEDLIKAAELAIKGPTLESTPRESKALVEYAVVFNPGSSQARTQLLRRMNGEYTAFTQMNDAAEVLIELIDSVCK